MPSLVQTIRDMQEAAMTARQKKAIAAIEKDKKLSDSEKFKKIDAVMNEEEQMDEFHAPGMAPKPRKKPAPSSTKKSLGDISKRANEEKAECPKCEGKGCDHCDNKGYHTEESDLEEGMYVVRYKGADKTSDSAPMSKAAAEKRAKRGNAADKVGGKYTVVPVNAKGHDVKEEVELEEAAMTRVAKELEAYARKNGGIDKMDFMKAAMMMKKGQKSQLMKFVDDLDTEPREKILSLIAKDADRRKEYKAAQKKMRNEEVELEEGAKERALKALMTKALGGKRAKPGYTSAVADNGDFVVKDGSGRIVGRIKSGDYTDPLKEDVDSLAKDFEARLKKQGYSSRTQDRERMATLAKAKKQGMNAMQMKQLDGKMNAIMNKMDEAAVVDTQATHSMDLLDTVNAILMGRRDELDEAKMDKVDKKALKKDYDDRKDKDIDNDGDEDDSDEYLHNKRKAVSKAIDKKDDAPKKKAKKPEGKAEPVDVEPTLGESEMSDSEEKKREEIVMRLKSKKDEFKKKYGDRWEKVMYATATKMAMKK